MKLSNLFSQLLFIALLSYICPDLSGQQQTGNSGFVPHVGQEGKDVIWVPTPEELVNKMLEISEVTAKDYVIDLGSGDGRTVIAAAKIGARALGIEYNPDMVELSIKNAKAAGVSANAKFIQADLFETDLSQATVITMFLLPEINLKLRPKLLDLKPGTRIVSNTFTMGDWEPDAEVNTDENTNSWYTALFWIVPAKVEGTWKFERGELTLSQEFQKISGTYKSDKQTHNITDGKLRGDIITFSIDGSKYTGNVQGKTKMTGTAVNNSKGSKWDWTATISAPKSQ